MDTPIAAPLVVCRLTHRIFAFAFPVKRCKEKQIMALTQTLKRHALLTYFVFVYVLTWACWIPMAIFQDPPSSVRFAVLYVLGNIMPSLVGILLTGLFSG